MRMKFACTPTKGLPPLPLHEQTISTPLPFQDGKSAKIGIVTAGKSYLDTRQALEELGIDEVEANKLGVRVLKVGMVWPLDPDIVETFAKGLDLIIVIEEKRSLLETQIKEQLYGRKNAPAIIGKKDENDETLFQAHGALDTNVIALELAKRLLKDRKHPVIEKAVKALTAAQNSLSNLHEAATRIPYFCAGCPHNSSTVVPEGGRGYAGIGCHWMAQVCW